MAQYKNEKGVSLSVAVWLAHDNYDHNPDPMTISVTSIIKPIKQIILAARANKTGAIDPEEISNLIASRMGTAFHDSIEYAWVNNYKNSLEALGYPPRVIDMIRINPEVEEEGTLPVYLERRSSKKVGPYTISGKFDIVIEGRIEDFKSTGTYSYTTGVNEDKYVLQESIYKWLNPGIITQDTGAIQFVFTDWQANRALSDKNYPQNRVMEHKINLLSLEDTQRYLENKVNQVLTLMDAPESEIPACTPEDLWQTKTTFKYYKDPAKKTRSTKNFDTAHEAQARLIKDKSVGVVVVDKGEVRGCKYCNARNVCQQAANLIATGNLKL